MVLIFTNKTEVTVTVVCDWLSFYNIKFIRANQEDNIKIIDNYLHYNKNTVNLEKISSVWFRRIGELFKVKKASEINALEIYRLSELQKIFDFNIYKLHQKKRIGNFNDDIRINRLIVIEKAKKVGLSVPRNFLVKNNKELTKLFNKNIEIISKTISGSALINDKSNDNSCIIYTIEVTKDNIEEFNNTSYFEEKIDKKFELRILYLHGKFWSMAIFSQRDPQTKLDFRDYNFEKPNRMVPFELPIHIERKLHKLMISLNLNSGSIDLIVNNKNEYIFLEVNPTGQFGMISIPCNYNIENYIAKYLLYE